MGSYNALQYLAVQTSTPLNVTLIAASMPVGMMLVGLVFYGERPGAGRSPARCSRCWAWRW